jgi:hypothetical protein
VGTITNFSSYRVPSAQMPCNPVTLCRCLRTWQRPTCKERTQADCLATLRVPIGNYAFLSSSALFVLRKAVVGDFGGEKKDLAASPPPLYTISATVRSSKEVTVKNPGEFMLFSIQDEHYFEAGFAACLPLHALAKALQLYKISAQAKLPRQRQWLSTIRWPKHQRPSS